MSMTFEHGQMMACPACVGTPEMAGAAQGALPDANIILSLPHIHCAACISGVERALVAMEGVRGARVNLTLKRVAIQAEGAIAPEALVTALAHAGFEALELDVALLAEGAQDDYGRMLLMRLGVAGFAMMNVMLLSVAVWSGAEDATRDLMHWISAAIALPAVAFAGVPFYTSAFSALRAGRLNMDVPITLAIVLAGVTSLYETMLSGHHAYFDAAIALTFFLLVGRYLEHRTRSSARSAAQELAALEVHRAIRIVGGVEATVPCAELVVGDVVKVPAGANMPIDGEIISGNSEMNCAFLTGESRAVHAGPGSVVHAGEVNLTGPIIVRVLAVGADTELRQIANLVALAESGRSRYASLADQAAKLYAPGVHILSLAAAIGWFLATQDLRVALNIAAAVLIITCPCALGLAVPAVTTAVSARLYKRGVLVKHETGLERLAEVDTVVFDKTGTLTLGRPVAEGLDRLSLIESQVLLGLTAGSLHPNARALQDALVGRGVEAAQISDVREVPGFGVSGKYKGQVVQLGRAGWIAPMHRDAGDTLFQIGEAPPFPLRFVEEMRDGARACVAALRASGFTVHILSGDEDVAVQSIADALGVTHAEAALLPAQKAEIIARLQQLGHKVLMVGDGLNDTAALSKAHVSISPASALDAARVASDFVLLDQSLLQIPAAISLSVQARSRMKENFSIASFYNLVAVPLAIAGMATPLIAALAMSASSLTVTLNALRLRA